MAKKIKTRKGKDGFNYPYTSPDLVIDNTGKSVTTRFEEIEDNQLNLIEDGTTKGIKDTEYDTLTTTNKTVIGSINELSSQFKDIAKNINPFLTDTTIKRPSFCLVLEMLPNESIENTKAQIDKIKQFGFNQIIICVKHELTENVWTDLCTVNNYDNIKTIIAYAKNKGIEVIALKPHINESNSDSSWFRITPLSTAQEWLINTYKPILLTLANICKEYNIEYLNISNELPYLTFTNYTQFLDIQQAINNIGIKTFCCLTYSEYFSNTLANIVDVVGLNVYPHLSKNGINTSITECCKAFSSDLRGYKYLDIINSIASRINKPLWITEIGCCRNVDALSTTEKWVFDKTEENEKIQEIFFESVINIFSNNTNIERVCFWSSRGAFSFLDNQRVKQIMEGWI